MEAELATLTKRMKSINRQGKNKRAMRNLIRRGRKWYFKKMVNGKRRPISLDTEDVELAKAKRNAMEQAALNEEWEKIKGPRAECKANATTLAEIFPVYERLAGIKAHSVRANKSSLLCIVRRGLGKPELQAEDIRLEVLTKRLARDYQEALRASYEAEAGKDEKARRMARDRADRTSKSTFGQGASIFGAERELVERYRENGIHIPECVLEFRSAKLAGKMGSKEYFPASDEVLRATFEQVEKLRTSEAPAMMEAYYMFWAALATGCRRNELADMKIGDVVELEGRLWIGAGLGKDGNQIRIPCINWQVHPAAARMPDQVLRELKQRAASRNEDAGYLFPGPQHDRHRLIPDLLNGWMESLGWKDEKKLHALRAYIGSKIFSTQPRLAQLYLRHKSVTTTETFYSHFATLHGALDFGPALAVMPAAA